MEQSQEQKKIQGKRLFETGLSYSTSTAGIVLLSLILTVLVALCAGGKTDGDWYKYLSFLLPQFAILGAIALYFRRSKEGWKPTLLVPCKWHYFLLAIALQLGLLFPVSALNELFIGGLQRIGYHETPVQIPTLTGWNILPALIVIGVLPAVFEEVLFRGILARNMKESGWGLIASCLLTGALFSLYHANPSQTLYQFASGFCLTLVAFKSGSVFPTLAAHFLNNALVLIFEATGYGTSWTMANWLYICVLVVAALLLTGALCYLFLFDRNSFDRSNAQRGRIVNGKKFFFGAAAGIAVCGIEWLVVLINGFLQ